MRVRNFYVAGIAWSNIEPGVDINESIAIFAILIIVTIDVAKVCNCVNVSIVAL
jgi:hypothetical protein